MFYEPAPPKPAPYIISRIRPSKISEMRKKLFALAVVGLALATGIFAYQTQDQLDRKQLHDMLSQLGYDVKDLDTAPGKEKYSFSMERGGLNIPVAAEISANGKYIWLTVF